MGVEINFMQFEISIKQADDSDRLTILDWRNDELTREMSLSSDLVSINDHNQWFKNASNSKNSLLLMCSRNPNTKIAFVHFKLNMTDAYVSINLNPDERGKGLSREVLKQAIEYLLFHHSQCKRLIAKIKDVNIPSIKIFISLGFKKYDCSDNVSFFEKKI